MSEARGFDWNGLCMICNIGIMSVVIMLIVALPSFELSLAENEWETIYIIPSRHLL